jgi:uncharacterized protein
METIVLIALIAAVSLLYTTAGQAGGTGFLAVMAFASFPAADMRPTALLLNVIAAGYATWRLHRGGLIELPLLLRVALPSLPSAFLGGLVVLEGGAYFTLTGLLLMLAAGLMVFKRTVDDGAGRPVGVIPAAVVGGGAGFFSGLTGIGGGVFLAPVLIALGWVSPKRAAYLSAPFILLNSILGFGGVFLAGQRLAPATALYALAALVGAIIGTTVGLRLMSERATRYALAAILLFAGARLLLR